jgi:hypothetical protein
MSYGRRSRRRSLESRLVFPDALVTAQRLVRDPLGACLDGLDRNVIEHPEDVRADSPAGLQNSAMVTCP